MAKQAVDDAFFNPRRPRLGLISNNLGLNTLFQKAIAVRARGLPLKVHSDAQLFLSSVLPPPDVVFIEVPAGERSSMDSLAKLRKAAEALPLLALCANTAGASHLHRCMAEGASGCVLLPASPEDIASAALNAYAGLPSSTEPAALLLSGEHLSGKFCGKGLSYSERKFMALAAKQLPYADIADAMGTSEWTTQAFRKRVFRKLNVHRIGDALQQCARM